MASPVNRPDNPPEEQGLPNTSHHRAQLSPATQLGVPLWKYSKQRGKMLHWLWRKKVWGNSTVTSKVRDGREEVLQPLEQRPPRTAYRKDRSRGDIHSTAHGRAHSRAGWCSLKDGSPWKGPLLDEGKKREAQGVAERSCYRLTTLLCPCTTQECCFISQNAELF